MYYLLENNRIIDSEISYTTNFPYWEIKDNCLFAKSKNDKLVRPCNENKIKKQSENVYDLIEFGDLVQTNYGSLRDVRGIQSDSVVIQYDCCIYFENIIAIYKLDANGNYIKVWEKKDESN